MSAVQDPVAEHRPLLMAVAYRMLGSVADAEDVVQEAWLRWSRVSEPVADPAGYLVRVVARLCLDELRSARARRERYVGPWLPEPVLTGADAGADPPGVAERREVLSLGTLTLLERLTPPERAALVLREALGLPHAEIAAVLGTSTAGSRQLLARARRRLAGTADAEGGAGPHRRQPVDPAQHRRLLDALLGAFSTGDLAGLVSVLREDVRLVTDGGGAVKAALRPIAGRDKVLRWLAGVLPTAEPGLTARVADVNGEPAVVVHRADGSPYGVLAAVSDGAGRVAELLLVANPAKLARLAG